MTINQKIFIGIFLIIVFPICVIFLMSGFYLLLGYIVSLLSIGLGAQLIYDAQNEKFKNK